MSDSEVAALVAEAVSVGVPKKVAEEAFRNPKQYQAIKTVFEQAKKAGTLQNGLLLFAVVNRLPSTASDEQRKTVVEYIASGKLKSELQFIASAEYIKDHPAEKLDPASFDAHIGVGVHPTSDETKQFIESLVAKNKDALVAQRYQFSFGLLFGEVKTHPRFKWADGKVVKEAMDAAILAVLGPKTDADNVKKAPAKAAAAAAASSSTPAGASKDAKAKDAAASPSSSSSSSAADGAAATVATGPMTKEQIAGAFSFFHKVGENFKTENYMITPNTMEHLKKHAAAVDGKVRTRFPPEPNGILHIGHAKAMHINFTFAKINDGHCIFRYDDTNPEKEEERFFVGIRKMVNWLGHEPWKVTHTSDYFQELYLLAVDLIKRNLAYVCHQNEQEVRDNIPSKWANRPIEESLILFEDMKKGKIDEGKATLRMKHVMEDGKIDPVAYRIKFHPHFKTGDTWCIYPTYDYSHCLIDSIENITHSLCTKEFQNRRYSYYWLCNALDVYCPVQWEYGRLNMNYTVMSKRKIQKLIEVGVVRDWDDPRLYTLMGLQRRGFPPAAINDFCARLGVTTAMATVDPQVLEACVRDELNVTADRVMACPEPLKVVIDNYDSLTLTTPAVGKESPAGEQSVVNVPAATTAAIDVLRIPGDLARGYRKIPVSKTIYIDRSDFREKNEAGYRRLTPEQSVALKYAGVVLTVALVERDASGNVSALHVTGAPLSAANKPKAFITWVAESAESSGLASSSTHKEVELRIINHLFLHKNPEDKDDVPGGWMSDVNPNSMVVVKGAVVDAGVKAAKVGDSFQFERFGFFAVDPDTTASKLVLNQIVSLKEDAGKN